MANSVLVTSITTVVITTLMPCAAQPYTPGGCWFQTSVIQTHVEHGHMEHLDLCTCHAQVLSLNVDVGYPAPATPWLVTNDGKHVLDQRRSSSRQHPLALPVASWHDAGATNQHALLYLALKNTPRHTSMKAWHNLQLLLLMSKYLTSTCGSPPGPDKVLWHRMPITA
jgi:hypothetical protein